VFFTKHKPTERKNMNAVSDATERVALYYREGSSDKVCQAAIEPAGNQFVVNFAYGRRGATLTTGTKTSSPVDYSAAKKIYVKLVSEKKAKGYTEGADGTPYQHTDKQASGILPQLLNPVEEAEVELLLRDDNYCAQEKFDGKHLLVRKQDDDLEGINKKGFVVGLPQTVVNDLRHLRGSFIPDVRKKAFELFLLHRRKGKVANLLNAAGYRTRGGVLWHDSQVLSHSHLPQRQGHLLFQPDAPVGKIMANRSQAGKRMGQGRMRTHRFRSHLESGEPDH
jgi:bifunctional non-homologous end joining protein LigD